MSFGGTWSPAGLTSAMSSGRTLTFSAGTLAEQAVPLPDGHPASLRGMKAAGPSLALELGPHGLNVGLGGRSTGCRERPGRAPAPARFP